MLDSPERSVRESPGAGGRPARPWVPLLALLVAVLVMGSASYFVYGQQLEVHRREAASRIEAGAALDAARVAEWFEGHYEVAADVIGSPFTAQALKGWQEQPTPELDRQLEQRLKTFRSSHQFVAVALYDASGRPIRSIGPGLAGNARIEAAVAEALRTGEVALTRPRALPGRTSIGLDFVAPILEVSGTESRRVGAIAMSADATALLASLGHTLAADDVGYVIVAWHNDGTTEYAIVDPATDSLPAVERFSVPAGGTWQEFVTAGARPAFETIGPSGEAVLAAVEPAGDSPAIVVVAQDIRAIRAHTLRLMAEVGSLALVGLAIAAALVLLWWRAERRRAAAELQRTTERAERVEARLGWLSREANDIILLIDSNDRIIDANERAVTAYGRSMRELVGMAARDLRPPGAEAEAEWKRQCEVIAERNSLVYEATHCRSDGTTFPVEISALRVHSGGRSFVQSIIRDITERKQQQERIERSEAAYRTLFQTNPHAMWAYDVESLRFLAVNDAAVAQYGYSEAEFLAMTIEDIRPPEELPRLRANLAEGGDAPLQRPGLWVHRRRNRELIDVEIVSHAMDFGGRRARMVLANDVTQRVRAERRMRASEERYRRLFEQASDGVLQFRADGTLLDANAEAQHMFGYTQEEFRAAGIHRVLAEKERERFERLARMLAGNAQMPAAQQQWRLVRKDGTRFTAEVRTRALGDDTFIATIRDLTEVIAAQQRIVEQRELRAAKDRAESADRAKTAFLRSVSHELRSPLHSIIGFTAALLEGIGGGLNAAQREQMQIVNDSARHLLDIINDLLDVSRIEAGAVSIEARSYRPADVLRRVLQRFSLQAAEKNLEFRIEVEAGDLAVVGDERRVEQVVSNLVSNAIKFTARGEVTVGLRVDGDRMRYEVTDTGKGIAAEDQPRLFNYFSQLDPGPDSLAQGTGLGLAIAMGLAEAMDGGIEVRSEPGRGSRFALVLPMRAPVEA